jgi:hypothetical protein
MFAIDRPALDLLIAKGIFSLSVFASSKNHAVYEREVRMSREILSEGWNIASIAYYRNVDFRFKDKSPDDYSMKFLGDVAYPKMFFGETLHPYECIFVKANRGQSIEWLSTYTTQESSNK